MAVGGDNGGGTRLDRSWGRKIFGDVHFNAVSERTTACFVIILTLDDIKRGEYFLKNVILFCIQREAVCCGVLGWTETTRGAVEQGDLSDDEKEGNRFTDKAVRYVVGGVCIGGKMCEGPVCGSSYLNSLH